MVVPQARLDPPPDVYQWHDTTVLYKQLPPPMRFVSLSFAVYHKFFPFANVQNVRDPLPLTRLVQASTQNLAYLARVPQFVVHIKAPSIVDWIVCIILLFGEHISIYRKTRLESVGKSYSSPTPPQRPRLIGYLQIRASLSCCSVF